MMLDRVAQGWLARALGELGAGQSRRFEDLLWLGFGDEWNAVLGLLVRDGGVKRAATNDGWVLQVQGEALRRRLVEKIEQMLVSDIAPYPAQRTLLVSGVLESCLTSRLQGQQRLETPHLS